MALTKVIGNGLGTLGDGTANDTKIVFDGNAQDYHIGLDDSADTLVIGKGSALGTTTSMSFDENGIITKPLQPAFFVKLADKQYNIAVDSDTTVQFASEIFDQNADFNTSTYTFTAPVTGRYQFNVHVYLESIDTAGSYVYITLKTSNRPMYNIIDTTEFNADLAYWTIALSQFADLDASDTCFIKILQAGGSAQMDINATSFFSGYLVC